MKYTGWCQNDFNVHGYLQVGHGVAGEVLVVEVLVGCLGPGTAVLSGQAPCAPTRKPYTEPIYCDKC